MSSIEEASPSIHQYIQEIVHRYESSQKAIQDVHELSSQPTDSKTLVGIGHEELVCLGNNTEEKARRLYEKFIRAESSVNIEIKELQSVIHLLDEQATKEPEERKRQKIEVEDLSKKHQTKLFAPYDSGTEVAMRRDSTEYEWMVTVVISFNFEAMTYVVEDISEDDDEESHGHGRLASRKRYTVGLKDIRPLPASDTAAIRQREFPLQHRVLALFPNTTCLYRATIVGLPSRRKKILEYMVQFDNDDIDGMVPTRPVPAKYVLDV